MKRSLKKKYKVMLIILVALVVLGGLGVGAYFVFGKGKGAVDDGVREEEAPKPVKKVKIVNMDSNTRPVAVMINNNSAVWSYQSGLMKAYMIYEFLVEGGITREMALFKDAEVDHIQSIRSSRHYFLDYALENDAIYVHWGWSPQAQSDIRTLQIANINGLTYEGVYFFRDKNVKAALEHKGYTTMESINKAIEKLKYRNTTEEKPLLAYSVDPLELDGEDVVDAKYIEIPFSAGYTAKFIYDEENKVYLRNQNKKEMTDFNTGERFTAKNIITYKLAYSYIPGDDHGRLNLSDIGSGDGYYISEGKAVPITWEKTSRGGKTEYKLSDGTPLVVNDGNTYIEVQPKNRDLKISAELPE